MASSQWMPEISSFVDHTAFASHNASSPHKSTLSLGNAWWGRTYGSFSLPPSSQLRLILVAVHINDWSVLNKPGALEYLKKKGPVGARDTRTLRKLQEKGVSTYFSGCLTLTWNPLLRLGSPEPRQHVVVVDSAAHKDNLNSLIPEDLLPYTVQYSNHQASTKRPPFHQPLQFAYGSMLQIAAARVVITSRIHVALPAVGVGTPVIFTLVEGAGEGALPGGSGGRTEGLTELFHVAYINRKTNTWRFHSGKEFDWSNPPENPSPHLRQRLIASLWSRLRGEEAMADNARMFGLFPRPPLPASGEEVEVVERGGAAALLTLRSLESVLFHHPGASVTLIRNMAWRLGRAEEEELVGHLETLKEAGYRVETTSDYWRTARNAWRIDSDTILLNQLELEKSLNITLASDIQDICQSEKSKVLDVSAVRIDISKKIFSRKSPGSSCQHIFNDFAILSDIIV